jgi:hypothetical protein
MRGYSSFVRVNVSNCNILASSSWMVVKIGNDLERMCKEAFYA